MIRMTSKSLVDERTWGVGVWSGNSWLDTNFKIFFGEEMFLMLGCLLGDDWR